MLWNVIHGGVDLTGRGHWCWSWSSAGNVSSTTCQMVETLMMIAGLQSRRMKARRQWRIRSRRSVLSRLRVLSRLTDES